MDAPAPESSDTEPSAVDAPPRPTATERVVAFLEILLCSDYPTQIALAATFAALGFSPSAGGTLSLAYVATLSLADTVLLIGLIVFFLRARGESPREVLFGNKPLGPELWAGVPLLFVAFFVALVLLVGMQAIAPWLHTVAHNPLQDLVRTPADAFVFALVLIAAGGIREEVQRAFLLQRFERWLGGARFGLVISSVVFGAGHIIQGADAAVATAVLGAFWGVIYLRRRSIGAPVVSHAGFNLVQILQYLAFAR
jgi:membrane protease YdiL (CAAX protease family)